MKNKLLKAYLNTLIETTKRIVSSGILETYPEQDLICNKRGKLTYDFKKDMWLISFKRENGIAAYYYLHNNEEEFARQLNNILD